MKRWLEIVIAAMFLVVASSVFATFHTFRIEQIYSNADGAVQFIVMHESMNANGENLWAGRTLTSTHSGVTKVFVFPVNLPGGTDDGYYMTLSPTANKRVLVATQGFAALGLVAPDYVVPNGFLPTGAGTVNFAGVDQVTYTSLPSDGVNAINRSGATIQNLATNFTGASASVTQVQLAVLNFTGLWWAAPAGSESGWGINFAHEDDLIFATWFTYDQNGNAWWLTLIAVKTASNTFAGKIFESRGPALNAVPFSPAAASTEVGTGTLTFVDARSGTWDYTVKGVHQTKAITPQVLTVLPVCTFGGALDQALATNYQGLWWAAPAGLENGWGVNFTHQGDLIFATWFTYNFDGAPLWLSAIAPKVGPGVYAGKMFRSTGPPFNAVPFRTANVTNAEVGTLTITFANGNTATYHYSATLGAVTVEQTKAVTRQVLVAPGVACQ